MIKEISILMSDTAATHMLIVCNGEPTEKFSLD